MLKNNISQKLEAPGKSVVEVRTVPPQEVNTGSLGKTVGKVAQRKKFLWGVLTAL